MGLLSTIGAASGRAFGLTRVGAAIRDAYFNLTTLLLPGNGTNGAQNNTFTDSSSNGFSITRNGNTTQGTFSPFSQTGWSNYFDGSGDYLSIPNNAAFDFGTGDFTMEAWIYIAGNSSQNLGGNRHANIFSTSPTSGAVTGYSFYIVGNSSTTGTGLAFESQISGTAYPITYTATISQNTWHHVAVARSGTTTKLFLNGAEVTSGTLGNQNVTNSTHLFCVGAGIFTGYTSEINGYISNARVVKGRAVYTSAYSVPTSPLGATSGGQNPPTGTQTSLLTCQSNRFVDNGGLVTPNTINIGGGTPSVQAFSPFAPTAAYSAATVGGSGYFDGTGDYLDTGIQSNLYLNSSDYTIEFWAYFLRAPGTANAGTLQAALTQGDGAYFGGVNEHNWYLLFEPTQLNFGKQPTAYVAAHTPTLNTWVHYAVVGNSSGSITVYVNGVSLGTQTGRTALGSASWSTRVGLGYYGDSKVANYFQGYMSSLRIVKGTQVYTGNFTPPIAPVGTSGPASSYSSTTNVNTTFTSTNTQLLLNYTNAGITDATAKNDLETVGNAQISTAQSKFGSGSMYFDGTGDWLTVIDNPNLQMGSGDFTIEGWFYLSATGVAYGIVSKGTSTTGWSVNITSGNKLQFSYTSSNLTGATTLSSATWYYFAVVRSGTATGNLKIYLNGSADATSAGAVTDNFNQTSIMYVGADRVGTSALNGYIDDLRITKGYARTIATPSSAFPLQ